MSAPLTCKCCLYTEGVEFELTVGAEVDPASMLCLHCQPCPTCQLVGTACTDEKCWTPREARP